MSHGGKRVGAGRPRKLSDEPQFENGSLSERQLVGLLCERLQEKEREKFKRAAYTALLKELHEVQVKATHIPVAKRKAWLESDEGKTHCADMDAERDDLVNFRNGNKVFSTPNRDEILVRARRLVARLCGSDVSTHTIDKCWKEYRALLWRVNNELDRDQT